MRAVAGTRRTMRELADGTIRVAIDIDPPHRAEFLELFGQIDMPVALAPLVMSNAEAPEEDVSVSASFSAPVASAPSADAPGDAPKGARTLVASAASAPIGPLCLLACQWCKLPAFWAFLNREYLGEGETPVQSELQAKANLCQMCGVVSRRELDTDASAAMAFHNVFRIPFMEFVNTDA